MKTISNVNNWKRLSMFIIHSIRVLFPYINQLVLPSSPYQSHPFSLSLSVPMPLDYLINPLTDLARNTRTL